MAYRSSEQGQLGSSDQAESVASSSSITSNEARSGSPCDDIPWHLVPKGPKEPSTGSANDDFPWHKVPKGPKGPKGQWNSRLAEEESGWFAPDISTERIPPNAIIFESSSAYQSIWGPQGDYVNKILKPFKNIAIILLKVSRINSHGPRQNALAVWVQRRGNSDLDYYKMEDKTQSHINAVERGLRAYHRLDRAGYSLLVPLGGFHAAYPELFQPGDIADREAEKVAMERDGILPSVLPSVELSPRRSLVSNSRRPTADRQRTRSRSPERKETRYRERSYERYTSPPSQSSRRITGLTMRVKSEMEDEEPKR